MLDRQTTALALIAELRRLANMLSRSTAGDWTGEPWSERNRFHIKRIATELARECGDDPAPPNLQVVGRRPRGRPRKLPRLSV
jgi:hypothetical protein